MLVWSLVGLALLLVSVQVPVPVSSLHWVTSVVFLHLLLYQVVYWVESPFLGVLGRELNVVFVLPHSSLVHRWC